MGIVSAAMAQDDWRRVAVPHVTPQAWLRSLDERWYAPRSAEFAQASQRLADSLAENCSVEPARQAWREAMLAWERLAAVQIGALIERRSARTLDFQPTRPAAIERAMADPSIDLGLVGAPAQGLPALEWLLWRALPRDGPAACAYARRIAERMAGEAHSLASAWARDRAPAGERDEDMVQRDFATLVNQLVGGADALRWSQLGRPRREGRGSWSRATSGLTRQAWQARAWALQQLLAFQPGDDAAVSLEAFLRGRGLNPLADQVRRASASLGTALAAASPTRNASVLSAERAAAALKTVLEAQVAPKLEVSIGFSDADGD
jgi:predicted lipoprotein